MRKEYKPANISTNSNASIQQRDSSQTRSQVNISGSKPCSFTKFEESLKTMASSQNNSINNDNRSSNRHLSTNNYMKPNLGNGNLKDSSNSIHSVNSSNFRSNLNQKRTSGSIDNKEGKSLSI